MTELDLMKNIMRLVAPTAVVGASSEDSEVHKVIEGVRKLIAEFDGGDGFKVEATARLERSGQDRAARGGRDRGEGVA